MLDYLEEGKSGEYAVEHFEITKSEATIFAIGCYGSYEIAPRPGKYTRLIHGKELLMSDTYQEIVMMADFEVALRASKRATNKVHINGLGLGIATLRALKSGFDVSVCEISWDVVELVGRQIERMVLDGKLNSRFDIIIDDALAYCPPKGARFDLVYHDIWGDINSDNWPEYKLLMRRWGHKTAWQGAWARDEIKRILRDDRRW